MQDMELTGTMVCYDYLCLIVTLIMDTVMWHYVLVQSCGVVYVHVENICVW